MYKINVFTRQRGKRPECIQKRPKLTEKRLTHTQNTLFQAKKYKTTRKET